MGVGIRASWQLGMYVVSSECQSTIRKIVGGVGLANCLQRGIEKFAAMISKLGQDSTCEIYYPEAQRP